MDEDYGDIRGEREVGEWVKWVAKATNSILVIGSYCFKISLSFPCNVAKVKALWGLPT